MKLFLDTNIIYDVFAERHPFYDDSAQIWNFAERGKIIGCVSVTTFNNLYYIMRREMGREKAERAMHILRAICTPIPFDTQILNQAIDSRMKDFEDAIQFFSALHSGADYLITRNVKDFPRVDIPVLTPEEFLRLDLDFS
ncbi:MAG: PIN domain-containing protein [Victivallaceae bacterium]|nr:PIN domain-containing protein [Victivallaceae bacterium]